jgi:hypothetical protein
MGVESLQEQNSNANTIIDHISVYKDKRLHVMKSTFFIQFSFTNLFFIAFLLYIPIRLFGKDEHEQQINNSNAVELQSPSSPAA